MVSMNGSVFESLGGVSDAPFRPFGARFMDRVGLPMWPENRVNSTSNYLDTPSSINI